MHCSWLCNGLRMYLADLHSGTGASDTGRLTDMLLAALMTSTEQHIQVQALTCTRPSP